MAQHGITGDPYRIFFPLGILLGIAGVSIWPLYYFEVTAGYSSRAHMFLQLECFVYAFIIGFLWTAMPRFTGTRTPSRPLQLVVAASLFVTAAALEAQFFLLAHILFLVNHLMLTAVLIDRFRQRKSQPPPTFPLIAAGIVAGLIGALMNVGIALEWIGGKWDWLGTRILAEGMILLLVLGVGGFLGPRLLGFAQLPDFHAIGSPAVQSRPGFWPRYGKLFFVTAGMSIVASVIVEYGIGIRASAWARASIATLLIAVTLHPWRLPAVRTTLAWCVWIAHWILIAALWTAATLPAYRIDVLHIMFMGVFTPLILAVGTRVVLSHGGHSLAQEQRSWPLRIGLASGLIALLARLSAPFLPDSYYSHLAWAALAWIAGMSLWGFFLLKRIRS